MISRINRLRAKKGFTMIEIIVVIAIIGILTSIVISALSYDNRPTVGKGMAKDMFYVAQEVYSSAKIAYPNAISASATDRTGFYAEVGRDGYITEVGMMKVPAYSGGDMPSISTYEDIPKTLTEDYSGTAAADLQSLKVKMRAAFEQYLTDKDGMEGTLYVLADNNYRVLAAYWVDNVHTISGTTGLLVDNNLLDSGFYCCAYPVKYSQAGSVFFGI